MDRRMGNEEERRGPSRGIPRHPSHLSQTERMRGYRRCAHCEERPGVYPGGLCRPCYLDPLIKRRYVGVARDYGLNADTQRYDAPMPGGPTAALPGTPEKIAVMEARNERGEQLHHPLDARWMGVWWDGAQWLSRIVDGDVVIECVVQTIGVGAPHEEKNSASAV